jgi:hypothetical protein
MRHCGLSGLQGESGCGGKAEEEKNAAHVLVSVCDLALNGISVRRPDPTLNDPMKSPSGVADNVAGSGLDGLVSDEGVNRQSPESVSECKVQRTSTKGMAILWEQRGRGFGSLRQRGRGRRPPKTPATEKLLK